jgi:hypothetical protein
LFRFLNPIANSTLLKLFQKYGGEMRYKSYEVYEPRLAGCHVVDGVTWKGGPITAEAREQALSDAVRDNPKGISLAAGVRMKRRVKKETKAILDSKDNDLIQGKTD